MSHPVLNSCLNNEVFELVYDDSVAVLRIFNVGLSELSEAIYHVKSEFGTTGEGLAEFVHP